jgi:hypothetical protein
MKTTKYSLPELSDFPGWSLHIDNTNATNTCFEKGKLKENNFRFQTQVSSTCVKPRQGV